MGIDELKTKLKSLNKEINDLSDQRRDVQQQIADLSTTFKVGDRVTYDGAKCVWQITAIRPGYGDEPKIVGAKIKKDGTPGVLSSHIYVSYKKELKLV